MSAAEGQQKLLAPGSLRLVLRLQGAGAERCHHQLVPAPAPLDGARSGAPRRPMLPFPLLWEAAVLGDPASSRLQGLLVIGRLHIFGA